MVPEQATHAMSGIHANALPPAARASWRARAGVVAVIFVAAVVHITPLLTRSVQLPDVDAVSIGFVCDHAAVTACVIARGSSQTEPEPPVPTSDHTRAPQPSSMTPSDDYARVTQAMLRRSMSGSVAMQGAYTCAVMPVDIPSCTVGMMRTAHHCVVLIAHAPWHGCPGTAATLVRTMPLQCIYGRPSCVVVGASGCWPHVPPGSGFIGRWWFGLAASSTRASRARWPWQRWLQQTDNLTPHAHLTPHRVLLHVGCCCCCCCTSRRTEHSDPGGLCDNGPRCRRGKLVGGTARCCPGTRWRCT